LLQHGVHEGGFAMVNVGNNSDITDSRTQSIAFRAKKYHYHFTMSRRF
jgi:hypothetical protein